MRTGELGIVRFPNQKEQVVWIFLIVLMSIFIGFFFPFSLARGLNALIKGALFLGIFIALYAFWFSSAKPVYKSVDTEDQDQAQIQPKSSSQTPKGFADASEYFHHQVIHIVRASVVASVAGLYFRKGDEAHELMASDCEVELPHHRCLIEEESLIDDVVEKKEAVFGGHLPPSSFLPGIDEFEIRSYAAVPLHLEEKIIGVLIVGSEAEDHFGEEDLVFLERCGRLISHVTSTYHAGWRMEIRERLWLTQLELESELGKVKTEKEAFSVFATHVQKIFPFHRLTLCIRDGEEGVIQHVYGQIDKLDVGTRFPLDEGLMGWILKRNAPLMIADMQEGNYVRPRYFQGEEGRHGLHSLLGLPLSRNETAWGCIALESRQTDQYHDREKQTLMQVLRYFESILERFRTEAILKQLQNESN